MSDIKKAQEQPIDQFWEQLEKATAVMLGSPDPAEHMQPMAPMAARDENAVWFFTRDNTDIARNARTGGRVHMCLVGNNHDYHACASGMLEEVRSQEHIDRFWSPAVAAWFEEGKEDPALTMLRLRLDDGGIWASTGSALRFGWEIAKSNMTGGEPDVGYATRVKFAA